MALAFGLVSIETLTPPILDTRNCSTYQRAPHIRTARVCPVTLCLSTSNTFTRNTPTFRISQNTRFFKRASTKESSTFRCKASASGSSTDTAGRGEPDEWFTRLPASSTSLYSHSLPCIEAWLRSIGFCQIPGHPEQWSIERPDWHAELVVDVTDLTIK